MDDNFAILILMIVSILAAVLLTGFTTWTRTKQRYAKPAAVAEANNQFLLGENDRLLGQVGQLEERIAVLERIATDPATRTTLEIEKLR